MIILIAIVLTAICLLVLALPFLQKGSKRFPSGASNARLDRQRLYGDLRLLDEERLLGHISGDDYQRQANDIRLRAAELVREEEVEARAVEAARAAAQGKGRLAGRAPAPGPAERRGGAAPR